MHLFYNFALVLLENALVFSQSDAHNFFFMYAVNGLTSHNITQLFYAPTGSF